MIDGSLPPGTRLSEDALGEALAVSRNTLREAFRLLTHERLVEHRLNRGVFVRRLTPDDVRDLYRLRRLLECGAVAGAELPSPALDDARRAVETAQAAALLGDHRTVGTSNMDFHAAIISLSNSRRAQELMRLVLAELRLVFHEAPDPMQLHEPYLHRNRLILDLLQAGRPAEAISELRRYLHDAEEQLVAAAEANRDAPATSPQDPTHGPGHVPADDHADDHADGRDPADTGDRADT